jgi:hypothetical protein
MEIERLIKRLELYKEIFADSGPETNDAEAAKTHPFEPRRSVDVAEEARRRHVKVGDCLQLPGGRFKNRPIDPSYNNIDKMLL